MENTHAKENLLFSLPSIGRLLLALLLSFGAAGIGAFATTPNLDDWYMSLNKPAFTPPNEVFGPVWTVLYVLIAVSLFLVWSARHSGPKQFAYAFFGIQLALNTLWSVVFFGFHQIDFAVVIILTLLANIFITAKEFYPISKVAAYLLAPYAAWVSFAAVLNVAIAVVN